MSTENTPLRQEVLSSPYGAIGSTMIQNQSGLAPINSSVVQGPTTITNSGLMTPFLMLE